MSKEYPWGGSRRFNAYPDYMRKKFGGRVQKLTIDSGFSCPNRDGTKGYGGCTFCLNDAFNPSYCTPSKTITQQIHEGIEFHEKRYRRAEKYLAYFQAFSNTHAPVDVLAELYQEALNCKGVIGLVIGTRPDCMDMDKLDLLLDLSKKHHIVVEYGIETIHNRTLERINRCHTFEETRAAIEMTAGKGIHVGGHLIFGLPGESRQDMLESAALISAMPVDSIKFHQLQIFKDTEMEEEFKKHPEDFNSPGEDEYLDFMVEYIELLNPAIIVERIAGETPPRYAVRKPWGPRYDQILVKFEKLLERRDTWQGKRYPVTGNRQLEWL
jgi:radical SAM protein (TIGR01212 family)